MLNHYDTVIVGEWNRLSLHFAAKVFHDAPFIEIRRSMSSTETAIDGGGTVENVQVCDLQRAVASRWTSREIWYIDLVGDTRDAGRNVVAALHAVEAIAAERNNFELNVLAPDHLCRRLANEIADKRWTVRYHRIPDAVIHADEPLSPASAIAEIARQALLASMISASNKTAMTLFIPKQKAIGCCSLDHLVNTVGRYRASRERADTHIAPQITLTVGDFVFLICTSSPFLPIALSSAPGYVYTPIETIFSNNISRACRQLSDDQALIESDEGLTPTLRSKLLELVQILSQEMVSPSNARTFDRVEVESWDGHRINVYTAGNLDQPPLLLVNAYGMPIEFMAPLAEAMKDRFYLVSWESRGIPSILAASTPYDLSPSAHVRDAFHIMELLSLRKPDVVGWCTGAHVALKMALADPGRIGKLVLLNGGYNFKNVADTAFQNNMRHVMLAAAQNMSLAKLYHRALYTLSDSKLDRSTADASRRTAQIFDSTDTSLVHLTGLPYQSPENLFRYASLIASFVKDEDYSGIDSLDKNTLIVTTKDDYTTGYLGSVYLSNRIGRAQIRFHPHGDHFLLYKEVDYLVDQMLAFLKKSTATDIQDHSK